MRPGRTREILSRIERVLVKVRGRMARERAGGQSEGNHGEGKKNGKTNGSEKRKKDVDDGRERWRVRGRA